MADRDNFDAHISKVIDRYSDVPLEVREEVLQKHAQNLREMRDSDSAATDHR